MSSSKSKCPTPEMILKYFYMELNENEFKEIEEHFSECDQCTLDDYYGDFIEQVTLSSKVQKEIMQNSNVDTFSVAAADSFDNADISEVISKDGKYIVKKIPYLEDEQTSLLVVMLTNTVKHGKISVYTLEGTSPKLIGSDLIDEDNKVCFEVSSNIQLKDIIVTIV